MPRRMHVSYASSLLLCLTLRRIRQRSPCRASGGYDKSAFVHKSPFSDQSFPPLPSQTRMNLKFFGVFAAIAGGLTVTGVLAQNSVSYGRRKIFRLIVFFACRPTPTPITDFTAPLDTLYPITFPPRLFPMSRYLSLLPISRISRVLRMARYLNSLNSRI